jgi:hypothetical protein
MLRQVQAVNNTKSLIPIKEFVVEKKCPPVKAGKPKIGPREGNSEWRAAVGGRHAWLRSRISVACMADEESIGSECDPRMTIRKRAALTRNDLGCIRSQGRQTKKSPLVKAG